MGWNSYAKLANHVRSEKGNVCGTVKDDRIYQVLLKYNFDLFRGGFTLRIRERKGGKGDLAADKK